MKFISKCRLLVWLCLGLGFGILRADATGFGLTAINSVDPVFVNGSVTTIMSVTNLTGLTLADVEVSNVYSASVMFTSVTNTYTTNYTAFTNGNTLTFAFSNFTNGSVAQLAFAWLPLVTGQITNAITVASSVVTNTASTNLVTSVYNFQADLGLSFAFVSQAYISNTNYWVITNDWVTYSLTVTNSGPATATGVLLTNFLPAAVVLKNVSPSLSYTGTNNLVFNLGTISNGASVKYQFTIQPTNAGPKALVFGVGAPGVFDTNAPNNQTLSAFFVTNYLTGTFTATTNAAQKVDQQNGLIEQTVQITSTTGTPVQAVRLVLTGLTNELFNAYGTNDGNPFVTYPVQLAAGGQVGMRLQYFPRLPFPFTNAQLHAYEVPATVLNYTPPPALVSTNFGYYRMVQLTNDGDMLLEFTNLGGSYTVIYSDNLQFSNAMIAPPAIKSGANRIQWLDYGPPATTSAPTNHLSSRFYKVIRNQ